MSQVIKLQFITECRRLVSLPKTVDELKQCASELFHISEPAFEYIDEDGDSILIHTNEEYRLALSILGKAVKLKVIDYSEMPSNRTTNNFLLESSDDLYSGYQEKTSPIQAKKQDKSIESIPYHDFQGQTSEFDELLENINTIFNENYIKTNLTCFECHNEIIDIAFICSICDDYAICCFCEQKNSHKHLMVKAYDNDALEYYNKIRTSLLVPKPKRAMISKTPRAVRLETKENQDIEIPYLYMQPSLQVTRKKDPDFSPKNIKKYTSLDESSNQKKTLTDILKNFQELGFDNKTSCIQALEKAHYDFDKALEFLTSQEDTPTLSKKTDYGFSNAHKQYTAEYMSKFKELGFHDSSKCFSALVKMKYNFNEALEYLVSNNKI
ncbi:hypothetical protein SteCoe_25102 [Stentor coeruleus]|uniref:UBA domain-containing protein n=1 Tax=Stentor coeruleus TaxID=5963 RepID=A0A1R2BGD2_9CILI|nr:hypothetical protein SteCoe_25102 [Stentor coeruleus]